MKAQRLVGYRLERWDDGYWGDVFIPGYLVSRENLEAEQRITCPGAKVRAIPVYEGAAIEPPWGAPHE